jgi:hypothetical protein
MNAVKFEQAYKKPLRAGDNVNTNDLPMCIGKDPLTHGPVMIVSCWEPSDIEWEIMKRDKKIYLGVMAHPEQPTQPPVTVLGCNPFTAFAECWEVVKSPLFDEDEDSGTLKELAPAGYSEESPQ